LLVKHESRNKNKHIGPEKGVLVIETTT